jgi:hypothetical protein
VDRVHAAVSEATVHIVSAVLVTTMQDLEHGAHAEAEDEATEVHSRCLEASRYSSGLRMLHAMQCMMCRAGLDKYR